MERFRERSRAVSLIAILAMLAVTLPWPAAQAALVGTERVVSAAQAEQARGRIAAALARDDLRQALVARGVDTADVQARVDALTDVEARRLAARLDELPTGGDTLELLLFLFIVLLITDILGYTDVFPFVKKTHRR